MKKELNKYISLSLGQSTFFRDIDTNRASEAWRRRRSDCATLRSARFASQRTSQSVRHRSISFDNINSQFGLASSDRSIADRTRSADQRRKWIDRVDGGRHGGAAQFSFGRRKRVKIGRPIWIDCTSLVRLCVRCRPLNCVIVGDQYELLPLPPPQVNRLVVRSVGPMAMLFAIFFAPRRF